MSTLRGPAQLVDLQGALCVSPPITSHLAIEPGKREEKQFKETQTLRQGKPPIKKPVAYRRCGGGGGQKRLYGKQATEKPLWQDKPLPKARGTQALIYKGELTPKTSRGPLAWRRLDEETTNTRNGR